MIDVANNDNNNDISLTTAECDHMHKQTNYLSALPHI